MNEWLLKGTSAHIIFIESGPFLKQKAITKAINR